MFNIGKSHLSELFFQEPCRARKVLLRASLLDYLLPFELQLKLTLDDHGKIYRHN